jgi:hypothetical protein
MAGACGSCTACCRVYAIRELNKPTGTWCQHCAIGKGCKIYAERPKPCVEFACEWLHSQTGEGITITINGTAAGPMPLEMRPDRCKVVFGFLSDDLMSAKLMPGSLVGLPGAMIRTLIDRYGEYEVEMEIDAEGHPVVPRSAKVLSCRQRGAA